MSMLGVGVFVGIKMASPDLLKTLDSFYDANNTYDIKIISTKELLDKNKDIQVVYPLHLNPNVRNTVKPILENIERNNQNYMGTMITLSNHTPFSNSELFEQIDLTYKANVYNEDTNSYEEVVYSYLEGTKLGDYIRSSHYAESDYSSSCTNGLKM